MSEVAMPRTLRWRWPDSVSRDWEAGFVGPGGAFALTEDLVLGQRLQVFEQRSPSLRATLERAADQHGDRPYLVYPADPARDLTYVQVRDRVAALSRVLTGRHGIGPGDRVAIASANCAEYVLLAYAVASVGAIVVGLNGWWTSAELDHGFALTQPALVVGDDKRLERIAAVDSPGAVGAVPYASLFDGLPDGTDLALPDVALAEDDPVMILFTSGTTGRAKGAVLTHRNLGHMALSSALGMALTSLGSTLPPPAGQPAAVHVTPFFHVSGVVPVFVSSPVFGIKLVFPPPGRWDETEHLRLTQEHGITSWSGVPTLLWRMLEHPDIDSFDLSTLRTIGVGGAMLPTELVRVIADRLPGVAVTNGYGMTESTGNGTRAVGAVLLDDPGTVGSPEPGVEIQIREPDGVTSTRDGDVGEIHVRGAGVFLGYWNDPEASAAVLDAGRWYRSGDFGRIEHGRLHLESRLRDLIIRGGENIYPLEIENRLVEHPAIDEAAVIGVDHPRLGQEVKAVVVTHDGATMTLDDVQRWVGETLAAFKVPAHLEVRESLPTTASGKVMKQVLEAESRP
jgi:acyl-CoA synthetase (AMP-forming)/AMP-acid ligase II